MEHVLSVSILLYNLIWLFQGSQAYIQAIAKVNIVTAEERDSILKGLEQVKHNNIILL